jgi:hypothetical protein
MQYLLMLYVNQAGWSKLTPAEQEQGVAAYSAYTGALTKAGVLPPPAHHGCDNRAHGEWQSAGAGWALRGLQRAAGRLLPHRRS